MNHAPSTFSSSFCLVPLTVVLCLCVTGCGGGGGQSDSVPGAAGAPAASAPAAASAGSIPGPGDTSSPGSTVPQSGTPNVQPIMVSAAPGLTRNMLTTSVTVCEPGTGNCATIDHVQVDTGSQGLRLLASALPAGLASALGSAGGAPTGECAVFGGGFAWGSVRTADVRMAGQLAAALPIQLIADPAVPTVPADCAASGRAMQSLAGLRANGILGIGLFAADCGSGCVTAALPRWYYACDASGACTASTQPLAEQVSNPVSRFALDNNGVVIDLPAIADGGAPSVAGSLIFGIGTQANNTLGAATVLKANAQTGYVSTTVSATPGTAGGARTYAQSYLDSGSNALFFSDAHLPQCGYWYCPAVTQTASASIAGIDGVLHAVTYAIGNANQLFASSNNAFANLAGIAGNSFGWGLPFFFGRRVYSAIAGRATLAGPGPYIAF